MKNMRISLDWGLATLGCCLACNQIVTFLSPNVKSVLLIFCNFLICLQLKHLPAFHPVILEH